MLGRRREAEAPAATVEWPLPDAAQLMADWKRAGSQPIELRAGVHIVNLERWLDNPTPPATLSTYLDLVRRSVLGGAEGESPAAYSDGEFEPPVPDQDETPVDAGGDVGDDARPGGTEPAGSDGPGGNVPPGEDDAESPAEQPPALFPDEAAGDVPVAGAAEDAAGVPQESVPSVTAPPESVPPESVPPESVPPESVPPESVPPESVPIEATAEEGGGQQASLF